MRLLTARELQKKLKVSLSEVYRLVEEGFIQTLPRKKGQRIKVAYSEFVRFQMHSGIPPCEKYKTPLGSMMVDALESGEKDPYGDNCTYNPPEGPPIEITLRENIFIKILDPQDGPRAWIFPPVGIIRLLKAADEIMVALKEYWPEIDQNGTSKTLSVTITQEDFAVDAYRCQIAGTPADVSNLFDDTRHSTARQAVEHACLWLIDHSTRF
ncbi:MAG: hypothetical protein A2107_08290 [Verrucomicrobia bacterium GWF2_62_7]|nr:MAG: hypothetical protein A2107_08290 [Verrucomicrobia bacterium GWF2_62_7]